MPKNLNSYFDDFIMDRVNDIAVQIINYNEDVKKLRKETRDLFDNIIKALPKEDKKLIFAYEEKTNQIDAHYFRIIYKDGFMDGLEVVKNIFFNFDYPNKWDEL
ncbi:hypothetical protein [Wukongibacter sp. M2B1]|uniref:hypothetical protein n=1 Tax=Wukongibacter sp. M2B1 TaxID=3088895 RepID=UPI003D7BED2E